MKLKEQLTKLIIRNETSESLKLLLEDIDYITNTNNNKDTYDIIINNIIDYIIDMLDENEIKYIKSIKDIDTFNDAYTDYIDYHIEKYINENLNYCLN